MAENKHMKQFKIGGVKASTFGNNLKNSAIYTVQDATKDLFPFIYDVKESNEDIKDAIKESLENISFKKIKKQIKSSDSYKLGMQGFKNAKKDIKKGIFNNRKRGYGISSSSMKDLFGDEFDFDFDDDSFNIEVIDEGDTNVNIMNGSFGDVDELKNTFQKSAASKIKISAEQHSQQMALSSTINDNIAKLVTFQNETTLKHYQETVQFYANVTELQKSMSNSLLQMLPKKEETTTQKRTPLDEVISYSGSVDFSKYAETIIKQNIPEFLDDISMGMFSLSKTMMSPDMMKETMESFKNNPLGYIASSAVKSAIPSFFKEGMEEFNKTLSDTVKTFAMQMNTYSKMDFTDVTDGLDDDSLISKGLKFALGKLLKLDGHNASAYLETSRYEKGKVDFDGVTRKAITEVIPMYLRKILSTLQGTKDEIIYDYENGKAEWASQRQLNYDAEKRMMEMSSNLDAKQSVLNFLNKDLGIKDVYDNKNFLNDVDVLFSAFKSNSLPRLESEMEMNNFRNFVMNTKDLTGRNAFKGDDFTFSTIMSAIHSSLKPEQKLRLASNGFDAAEATSKFIQDTQNKLDINGLGQILSTSGLKYENSSDYNDAILQQKYDKIARLNKEKGFSVPIQSKLEDIKRILLEGIIVYNGNSSSSKNSRSDIKNLKLKSDEIKNEENRLRDYDLNALNERLKSYFLIEEERIKNGKGSEFLHLVDENYEDSVNELAKQMLQHKLDNQEEKKEKNTDIKNPFAKFFRKPFELMEKGMKDISKAISITFFGSAEERKELLTTEEGEKVPFHKFIAISLNKIIRKFDLLSNSIKENLKKLHKYIFGSKDKNGKYTGGIFSSLPNMYKNAYGHIKHTITGNKTKLINGEILEERSNSLNSMFKKGKDSLKANLFGDESKSGLLGNVKNSLNDNMKNFQNVIFGKELINKESADKIVRKYAPNAVFGGSLGLLGSMFLPGGPLLGAAVGSLASIGAKSGHLSTILFGSEETGNTVFGKKFKGIFENELVQKGITVVKNNSDGIKGGSLGFLAGMFLPGGPLLGATVGSLLGINKKTGMIDDLLFGKEDREGLFGKVLDEEKREGMKKFGLRGAGLGLLGSFVLPGGPILGTALGALSGIAIKSDKVSKVLFGDGDEETFFNRIKKDIQEKGSKFGLKTAVIASSGLLGSMFLPGGPILGGITGLILGNTATKKQFQQNFKRFLWGDYNPETGQGRIGQLEIMMNGLKASFVIPLKNFAQDTIENGRYWMEQNVFIPIKYAMKPFTDLGKHIIGKGEDFLKRHVLKPVTNRLMNFLEPVRKAFVEIGKDLMSPFKDFGKLLIKAAVGTITAPSNLVRQYNALHGIGSDDFEHEVNRAKDLTESTERHLSRKQKLSDSMSIDKREANSLLELNRLQIKQANAEKEIEAKRRKFIFEDLTEDERNELDLLKKDTYTNGKLMLNNFGLSEEEKAKNRDKAREAAAKYNAAQKRIFEARSKLYESDIEDENGNIINQSKEDKKALDKIAEETRIYHRMAKEKGAYSYSETAELLKAEDLEKQNRDKALKDTADSNQEIAANTAETKNYVKKLVNFFASGSTKDLTEDLDTTSAETGKTSGSTVEEISDSISSNIKEEQITDKVTTKDSKTSVPVPVKEKQVSVNRDNSSQAILDNKMRQEKEKREIESHGILKSIEQHTGITATTLTDKLGRFGKIFNFGKSLLKLIPSMLGSIATFKSFITGDFTGLLRPGRKFNNLGNKATSKAIKSFSNFFKNKGLDKTIKKTASNFLESNVIGQNIKKFFSTGVVKNVLGETASKKLAGLGVTKLLKGVGKSAIQSAGRALLKAPLSAAFIATDVISGADEAGSYFKVPSDQKVSGKMRIAASVGKALANNLLFGLVKPENMANVVYKAIATDEEEQKLTEMQESFYAEAEAAGMSADDYNEHINAGFLTKTKNALFGKKDSNGNYTKFGWLNPFSWGKTNKSTTSESGYYQDMAIIGSGRGRKRSTIPNVKRLTFNGRGTSNSTNSSSKLFSSIGSGLNPLKSIKDSFSNPLVSSLITSLKPLYGNASAIVAPALLGLTLTANNKILDVIKNAKVDSTETLSNNVTAQEITKSKKEKRTLTETISSIGSSIASSIKGFFNTNTGSGKRLNGRGGNNSLFTGRGTNNGHAYFSQLDPKWSNKSLSDIDDDTIGSAGCGPTAVAMALKSRGIDTDPLKASQFASSYKVKDQGVSADFISDYGAINGVNLEGRSVDNYSMNDIDVSLASGQPVVALGKSISGSNPYTSAGHYITISGKDENGNYLVSDPLNANNNNKSFTPLDLLNNTSAYWTDGSIDGSTTDVASLMGYGLTYSKVINPSDGVITSNFGPRVVNGYSNNHTGIDYGTYRQEGKNIYAVADGTITKQTNETRNGQQYGYGVSTYIKHPDGTTSIYGHLKQNLKKVGDTVASGERIGLSGNTGWSTGPHLHFEMRDSSNKAFDPTSVLESGKLPSTSEVIENPSNFERESVSSSSSSSSSSSVSDKMSNILSTISSLFKGLITGNFGEESGDESSTTDTTTSVSNTVNASAYATSYKDLNWLSKTTGQKGDGPLIEMAARFETGGADVGKISSGNGDYGGKSYGLPQYTYKANGVAGTGSLKTFFMDKFMAANKDKYPNVWKALNGHTVYSQSFDNAWKNLANTHYDEFYQAQSDSATQQYYEPIRSKLEAQGYEVGRQPKAIHSAILSRGIQVFNRTHDTLFPEAFKRLGMSAKEASDHPAKVLNALYQVQLDKTDTMFRSSSSETRSSLRNNRFSLTNANGEFAYANEILSREQNGDIYRPEEKTLPTVINSNAPTATTDIRSSLKFNNAVNKTAKLALNTGGRGRGNLLSKLIGRGGSYKQEGQTSTVKVSSETPSVTLNNYMQETSSKISSTMALDYITQNMNLALEQVISLLSDIRESSKQTAENTKTISEKDFVVNQVGSGDTKENSSSSVSVNDNRKATVNQNNAGKDFFLGNMGSNNADPSSNLKRKIMQIAQG